jgi:aldehyde dehydrogenase (NAD+)
MAMEQRDAFLIGGRWVAPADSATLEVVSPITEDRIGRVPQAASADIDAAVASAREAFDNGPWPRMTVRERGEYLIRAGKILSSRLEETVRLQIDEMGAPYSFMSALTAASVSGIAGVVNSVAAVDQCEIRDGVAGKIAVTRQPVGVVAGIIPWNGPVLAAMSKILSAVLTGCTIVLKPAPETPLSCYLIADALVEAGLPAGVVSIVPGGREAGEHLVRHPAVNRVTFTGSTAAGARVAAICGGHLKSVTLELGGKSAAIVLPDADIDRRVPTLIGGALPNTGQICNATTRVLVPRQRRDEIVARLVDRVGAMKVGNPHEPDTDFGPLVAARQRDRVEEYLRIGRAEGARVVAGGGRPAGFDVGWYVEPTIFVEVDNSMRIAREEIFGPVLAVIDYDGEDEAVAIANDSDYGLGGAVYTEDIDHGFAVARRIETGSCRVNEAPMGGAGGPFGGVKRSGLGRENAREGHEGYYNVKTISLPPGYVPASSADEPGAAEESTMTRGTAQ